MDFPLLQVGFLVLCSAFFSASETALFSLSRFQLRQIKQKSPKIFTRIRMLLDRPASLVATVLLGNECANLLTSNLLTSFYESYHFSPLAITVINLITVMPIILILGEITPKIIAAKSNMIVVQFLFPTLWFFYRISLPIRFVLESIVNFLTKGVRKINKKSENIREDDIRVLLEDGKKKGAFHSVEQDMIENVFEIDDDKVIELATPTRELFTVDQEENPKNIINRLKTNFHARIPVRSGSSENIVGVLYAKDLLAHLNRDDKDVKIKHLMKEPIFVEPTMKADALFRRFRQMKVHIAIVADSHGKALGAITMEDLLEQMFGELWGES